MSEHLDPGHVTAGGAPWRVELAGALLLKLSVSEMDNNVYLLTCASTGERLLVDAADDAPAILALLDRSEHEFGPSRPGELAQVVTTHQHWDHHRALAEVVDATGARTLAGDADADALPVAVGRRLEHGDTVEVGDLRLDVIGLRGHTPGSIALGLRPTGGPEAGPAFLLTGDSLFPGGPGRTTSPEAFTSLMDDLEERVFGLYGDDTIVLPGHGDNTVLGRERPQLAAWRARGW